MFFTAADVNDQLEDSKDYDSDNLKRGRLAKVSTRKVEAVLTELAGKQLPGYVNGCEIQVDDDGGGYRFTNTFS